MNSQTYILEMDGITKVFPGGVVANDDVDLAIKEGEIHGILGENGAGKSTLMNVLFGLYDKDGGEIRIRGETVDIESPREALDYGIGMVHQHFKLVPTLNVVQNLIIGAHDPHPRFRPDDSGSIADTIRSALLPLTERFSIDLQTPQARVESLIEEYEFDIDPCVRVGTLNVGEKQRVEILKALYRDVDLLILDEPTAVLSPQQSERLFETLTELVDDGLTIVFITHKLDEIKEITDRTTILREGKSIDTVETDVVTEDDLARMMVGRGVVLDVEKTESTRSEEAVLIGEGLSAQDDRKQVAVDNVNLTLNRGEILGIAGVSGNGQRELSECLTGNRPLESGSITVDGVDLTDKGPREFIDAGVAFIPEDRLKHGLVQDLNIIQNAILKDYRSDRINSGGAIGRIDRKHARKYTEQLVEKYDVRVEDLEAPARTLSGGNAQKLILGREIERDPDIIVANQPTWGVDVGAIEYIRNILIDESTDGTAVLLISESLDEILSLSDRILVMSDGNFVYETTPETANREEIGMYMTGETMTTANESPPQEPATSGGESDD